MITKFVSEPSEKINGGYNVMRFNEVDNEYQPIEKGLSELAARHRAKFLNEEYILNEIRYNYANHPKDKHLFVDNSNSNHFQILLNITESWDDVLLIEFYEKDITKVLHGNEIYIERGLISSFCGKMLSPQISGYTEYLLEEIFPDSASIIDSKVKEIVDSVNRK